MNDGWFFAGFPLATGFSSPRSGPIDLSRATSLARHVTHDTSRTARHGHAKFPVGGHPLRSCIPSPTSDIKKVLHLYVFLIFLNSWFQKCEYVVGRVTKMLSRTERAIQTCWYSYSVSNIVKSCFQKCWYVARRATKNITWRRPGYSKVLMFGELL